LAPCHADISEGLLDHSRERRQLARLRRGIGVSRDEDHLLALAAGMYCGRKSCDLALRLDQVDKP
jgi:hypothetical protein